MYRRTLTTTLWMLAGLFCCSLNCAKRMQIEPHTVEIETHVSSIERLASAIEDQLVRAYSLSGHIPEVSVRAPDRIYVTGASDEQLAYIEKFVAKWEKAASEEPNTFIVRLHHVDAAHARQAVMEEVLIPHEWAEVTLCVDARTNRLFVTTADVRQEAIIKRFLLSLDQAE